MQARPESRTLRFPAAGPKCADLGGRLLGVNQDECWQELQSHPGCHVWTSHHHSDRSVSWTGACSTDTAEGSGTLSWTASSEHGTSTGTGSLTSGTRQGHWTQREEEGHIFEGPCLDGERRGVWTASWPDGDRFEGEVRDGKPNGPGIHIFASGHAFSGRFRDGCLRHESGQELSVWTTHEACGFK